MIYIDFENDPWSIRERLESLRVSSYDMRRVAYYNPSDRYTQEQWEVFKRGLQIAQLVIVDGVSNAMNLFGYNPMEHKGAVDFEMNFLRPLAAGGAAVVAVDHAPKNDGGQSSVFGAQHKMAAVTGAIFRFEVGDPLGRGLKGYAKLYLEKDKPGYLRQHTENDDGLIAELVLTSLSDGTVDARLNTPTIGSDRPTGIMTSLSRFAERHPGVSLAELKSRGTSSTDLKIVQKAVEILLDEDYLVRDNNGKFTSKRKYRLGAEGPERQVAAPTPNVAPRLTVVPGQPLEDPPLSIDDDENDTYRLSVDHEAELEARPLAGEMT